VLNGLYGSRLLLINNQVRHESQQWGTDHAVEIDPFAALDITVVKNADAVRYGPDALAGVILLQPAPIKSGEGIHGAVNTVAESNARSGALHAEFEGRAKDFAYRIGATAKRAGNIKSADYYVGNTGLEELNFNGLLRYKADKHTWELSYNHFGTIIGVFEGAHIGSKEDILARIAHGRPFEEYDFSYTIAAPKQDVQHDVAKMNWQYQWLPHFGVEATYSIQRNHRKEYDLRRVQSDLTPMADMVLTTQSLELLAKSKGTTFGISGSLQVNNNTPGTGTTPIIPNFDNHTVGIFASQRHYWGRNVLELGLRYDYKYFDVAGYRYDYKNPNVDGSVNQYLLTDRRHFNNLSGVAGTSIVLHKDLFWKSHIGLAWRAPSANELYSDGIHHGTGTYEVGDPTLKSEKGIKWVNNLHFDNQWLIANLDVFVQSILDYSYAQPYPDSLRQTIRGTFPLFQYKQTNALLYGSDLNITVIPHEKLEYAINMSTVVGRDRTQKTYLPYIPSDRLQQSLLYRLNKDTYLRLSLLYVAEQKRYEEGSDYAAPPPSYHMFGLVGSHQISLERQQKLTFQLGVENILNTAYKDYMDRFRYYAHLQGRNVTLKLNYNF
jgi:iron complex outermembrane receptor protein